MSPTSSGSLEVEKYIGACLISQTRPKGGQIQNQYFQRAPDAYPYFDGGFRVQRWAGGMPLISFANYQKRRVDHQRDGNASPKNSDPLARLAVHTQGAPLILTKTFTPRRNKHQKGTQKHDSPKPSVDCASVASDESSGSANSENCLPRIIKPRKRRKKDRKPLSRNQEGFSTDSASPDIDTVPIKQFTPFVFDSSFIYGLVPEGLASAKPEPDFETETPQLHHKFEDVEEAKIDFNGNQSTTVCQCRYCDPAGQIWDVDRNCYSPFLTSPKSLDFPDYPTFLTSKPKDADDYCLVHAMSSISLDGYSSSIKEKTKIRGDLEVSTSIVTSLNGHRDLEIKFFSSSNACDKSVNECKFVAED